MGRRSASLLCDQHLFGEHSELHQLVGTLQTHSHGEAIVRGHAERNQLDTSWIASRHDELAAELDRRGLTHESPLEYEDEHDLGSINVDRNLVELSNRFRTVGHGSLPATGMPDRFVPFCEQLVRRYRR